MRDIFRDMESAQIAEGRPDRNLAGRPGLSRTATVVYLLTVYAALQAYLWLVVPLNRPVFTAAGALVILAVVFGDPWRRGETPRSLGLDFGKLAAALRRLLVPAALLIIGIIITDLIIPGHAETRGFARRFTFVLPWAFLQQLLLQATFNRRLAAAFGP